jgi:hypothetical protein
MRCPETAFFGPRNVDTRFSATTQSSAESIAVPDVDARSADPCSFPARLNEVTARSKVRLDKRDFQTKMTPSVLLLLVLLVAATLPTHSSTRANG